MGAMRGFGRPLPGGSRETLPSSDENFRDCYDELRRLARRCMRRERRGITLDATELVHEAYLRLNHSHSASCRDRAHFLHLVQGAMRHVLVERGRRRRTRKRGGGRSREPLDDSTLAVEADVVETVAVDDAVDRLGPIDERLARVVELRFFDGLTVEETADALDVSASTVKSDWRAARAWLRHEIGG